MKNILGCEYNIDTDYVKVVYKECGQKCGFSCEDIGLEN